MWESWDAVAPDGTPRAVSMNHYAFGCVDDWLFRRVAGIQTISPGYREFSVAPDFEIGIDRVEARIDTPYGLIEIIWSRGETAVEMELTVPSNTRAHLRISGNEETLASGFHRLTINHRTTPLAAASAVSA